MCYIYRIPRQEIYAAVTAPIFLFAFVLYAKWIPAIDNSSSSSAISQYTKFDSDEDYNYRPCIIQLYGELDLRKGTSVGAAGARLSVVMAQEFAHKQDMAYYLYDCLGSGSCGKAPAIRDACYSHQCTHVLYIDEDVLLHDTNTDVVRHMAQSYPDAVMMMGIDYYGTMKDQTWHDGKQRMFRTDSNTGMIQFKCGNRLSKRILAEWERLCRRFSPHGSDQEAVTLMETFPQYEHMGAFVRDALILGQYSVVARHFPGDPGSKMEYPLPNDREFEKKKSELENSGHFQWLHTYWKEIHGTEVPDTEKWRLDDSNEHGWSWNASFEKCPLNQKSYVTDLLSSLYLDNPIHSSLDELHESKI